MILLLLIRGGASDSSSLPSSPRTSGEKEVIFIDPEALDLLVAINKCTHGGGW